MRGYLAFRHITLPYAALRYVMLCYNAPRSCALQLFDTALAPLC